MRLSKDAFFALFEACRNVGPNDLLSVPRGFGIDTVMSCRGQTGRTLVHLAAEHGDVDMLRVLVNDLGAARDVQCDYGIAPLHVAAMKGHCEVACVLVRELGVAVDSKDGRGRTALQHAAFFNRSDFIVMLVRELGAAVEATDTNGSTPLHTTCLTCTLTSCLKASCVLTKVFGVSVNALDDDGLTPLHHAARGTFVELVQLLLDQGADVDAVGLRCGRTPLQCAMDAHGEHQTLNAAVAGGYLSRELEQMRRCIQLLSSETNTVHEGL